MKQLLLLATIAGGLAGGHLAYGEEDTEKPAAGWTEDFSVAIGTRIWINEWRSSGFNNERTSIITFLSEDAEVTPIPVASIKYKNFFIAGSYYPETEFNFKDFSETVLVNFDGDEFADDFNNDGIEDPLRQTRRVSAERSEWDITFGYFFTSHLAFTVGYKEIEQEFQDVVSFSDFFDPPSFDPPGPQTSRSKTKITGPTLGLIGSVPIGNGFGVYGSFAYGFFETGTDFSPTGDKDVSYILAEGGITYTHNMTHMPAYMPLSAATVFAGYRFQSYDTEDVTPSGDDGIDEGKGFVVGVNLSF